MITAIVDVGQHYCQAVSDLWQWDYGQTLRIQGVTLPAAVEVQFSTTERIGETMTRIGVTRDGVTDVPIPDTLLEGNRASHDYVIYAFIYVEDAVSGKTEHKIAMNVRARPKPQTYEAPEGSEEAELFQKAIVAVNESADRAERARDSAEKSAHEADSARDAAEKSARAAQESADEAVNAAESIKNTKIPTKTSELENDSGFLASADGCIDIGRKENTDVGARSAVFGSNNTGSGVNSFVSGENNIASGQGAHAEGGAGTVASDKYAHAEGYGTTASGQAAHSEGYNTYATGKYSHVEGYNSKSTADMAHAENYGTEANGKCSHAEGFVTVAKGNASHAEGYGTVASGKYQHVQGKYNVEDTEGRYAHIVGSGSDAERRNIHTLDWEGNAEYAGDVTATVNGKKMSMSTIAGVLLQPGAAAHNAIYREKYLGDTVTAEQAAAIADGSFEDLFIGGYWTMGGVNYRIADFDYWYGVGYPESDKVKKHHAVIVPDTAVATGQMNTGNTTSGGYYGSNMKQNTLNAVASALPDEIRSRLLTHRMYTDGRWVQTTVDLMNEIMLYGCYIYAGESGRQTAESRQLSLFRLSSQLKNINYNYWLRNDVDSGRFALVSQYGDASCDAATSTFGIRPVFAITGE